MIKSANKKRKEVTYNPGDMAFLSSRNIKTTRPFKKLDDKMLGPFKVLKAVGASYRLQLPTTIRIHDVFHPSLLRKASEEPFTKTDKRAAATCGGGRRGRMGSRRYPGLSTRGKRLQYKVRWKGLDQDLEWYNADGGEFDNCQDLVEDFHKRYPIKPRYPTKTKKARKA